MVTNPKRSAGTLRRRIIKQRYILLMMLPAGITLALFNYAPLFGWVIAFTDYRLGKSMFEGEFVGLRHFMRFFTNTNDFGYLIKNTLVINVTSIILALLLALVFSILLNELPARRYGRVVQAFSFFPYFISWILIYAMMNGMFAVKAGAINVFLKKIGVIKKGINLLADAKYSYGMMITLNIWKSIGYNSIIFLATIKGISNELYEAASLDGASRIQRIIYVTVPLCVPTLSILLVMTSGSIFSNNLEQYFVFWNSTNWRTMEVLDTYIYNYGMKNLYFSYATATGILKSLVSLGILLSVNGVFKRVNGTSVIG